MKIQSNDRDQAGKAPFGGFSLVELLVVLAIVGILVGVVIESISTSRTASRDDKRMSDLKELQLGLAVYYNVNLAYPAALSTLATQKFIPEVPTDPSGSSYEYLSTGSSYCLGTALEGSVPNDSASCTSQSSGSTANYKVQPPQ